MLAAIGWVVENKNADGMNIRVLNLSFGTDGVQSYLLDPLAYAAEVAWRKGVVVVVAAGNGGYGTPKLNNPPNDPFVLAVGASDGQGTYSVNNDIIPSFSSTDDGGRNPDLVAPGKSIVSLKAPGSYIDETYPGARAGSRFLRQSGTSQAAAMVSGGRGPRYLARPSITEPGQRASDLDRAGAARRRPEHSERGPRGPQAGARQADAVGPRLGPAVCALDLPGIARSSPWLAPCRRRGRRARGESDILGPFDVVTWPANSLAGRSCSDGAWNGRSWSSDC